MNDWVRRATDGDIRELIEESDINEQSLGFFLNAFVLDAVRDEPLRDAPK